VSFSFNSFNDAKLLSCSWRSTSARHHARSSGPAPRSAFLQLPSLRTMLSSSCMFPASSASWLCPRARARASIHERAAAGSSLARVSASARASASACRPSADRRYSCRSTCQLRSCAVAQLEVSCAVGGQLRSCAVGADCANSLRSSNSGVINCTSTIRTSCSMVGYSAYTSTSTYNL